MKRVSIVLLVLAALALLAVASVHSGTGTAAAADEKRQAESRRAMVRCVASLRRAGRRSGAG